jgi:integral membrane protein (TIGR03766 family)
MKKFYSLSQYTINIIWLVLFSITLYYAWTSDNIILGDNHVFGTSTTFLTTFLIITIILIIFSIITFPAFKQLFYRVFITNKYISSIIFLIFIVIFQIIFIAYVHPVVGFDAGMLHFAAISQKHVLEPDVVAYYSLNNNNLPIMLLMRWIVVVTHQTSWFFFDYVTLFLVDLSALLNILCIFVVKPQATATAIYFHCGWLALFPSIIMPYTDAWVLPLVSLYLLCYFIIKRKTYSVFIKIPAAIIFGITSTLTYFMKPSAIIPIIAILIIEILNLVISKKALNLKKFFVPFLLMCLISIAGIKTYQLSNKVIQNQDYIQIQKWRAIPAIHFIAIGIYGDGGYSKKQAVAMAVLPKRQEKVAYSKRLLLKRLKKLGPFGYLKFLIKKQGANTADGTFGWLREGHFFRENQKPPLQGISNLFKNFIYLYGRNIADFRFAAQLWWIFLLTAVALGFGKQNQLRQMLKLALVGGFIFLLIFEGGRSRYMIQFLPILLLLASISFENTMINVKRLTNKYNGN